jgi:hypothetical protein
MPHPIRQPRGSAVRTQADTLPPPRGRFSRSMRGPVERGPAISYRSPVCPAAPNRIACKPDRISASVVMPCPRTRTLPDHRSQAQPCRLGRQLGRVRHLFRIVGRRGRSFGSVSVSFDYAMNALITILIVKEYQSLDTTGDWCDQ